MNDNLSAEAACKITFREWADIPPAALSRFAKHAHHCNKPGLLVVRIYQLNDDADFQSAEFMDLWKDDLKSLGNSLLTRDEVVMNPAAQMTLEYPRHEQTRFVAVMGVFRKPEESSWRDIHPLSEGYFARRFGGKIVVHLKGSALEMVD